MKLRGTYIALCQSTRPFRVTQEFQLCEESLLPMRTGTLRSATARYIRNNSDLQAGIYHIEVHRSCEIIAFFTVIGLNWTKSRVLNPMQLA